MRPKLATAEKLYELGGRPIDKMAAMGLTYGSDWLEKLQDAPKWLRWKHYLPSNKDLQELIDAGPSKCPPLYLYAKKEIETRAEWAKRHAEKMKWVTPKSWTRLGKEA